MFQQRKLLIPERLKVSMFCSIMTHFPQGGLAHRLELAFEIFTGSQVTFYAMFSEILGHLSSMERFAGSVTPSLLPSRLNYTPVQMFKAFFSKFIPVLEKNRSPSEAVSNPMTSDF